MFFFVGRRSVFGGTVGPNPTKPSSIGETQFYEGIKVRPQPLLINMQQQLLQNSNSTCTTTSTVVVTTTASSVKKRIKPTTSPSLTVDSDNNSITCQNPASPASPILKAQLSAPPKQRDAVASTPTSKGDLMKSQVNDINVKLRYFRSFFFLFHIIFFLGYCSLCLFSSFFPSW